MSNLLSGVTVVELASWTYVPSAGVVLRDRGADVIKIEDTRGGDPCRYLTVGGLDPADSRVSANFMMEIGNHGKRSIGMNIKSPVGRDVFAKLIAPGGRLPDELAAGATGARRAQRRHDSKAQSRRGHRQGKRPGQSRARPRQRRIRRVQLHRPGRVAYALTPAGAEYPFAQGPALGDLQGGATLAGGIAAALFHRERTGHPAVVDSPARPGHVGRRARHLRSRLLRHRPHPRVRAR